MPQYERLKEIQDVDMRSVASADRGRVGAAKAKAATAIPLYRALLFPEDD